MSIPLSRTLQTSPADSTQPETSMTFLTGHKFRRIAAAKSSRKFFHARIAREGILSRIRSELLLNTIFGKARSLLSLAVECLRHLELRGIPIGIASGAYHCRCSELDQSTKTRIVLVRDGYPHHSLEILQVNLTIRVPIAPARGAILFVSTKRCVAVID